MANKKCPRCGSRELLEVIYGSPTHELFLQAEAGKVKLGGCCIEDGSPDHHCKDCGNEWNTKPTIGDLFKE